MQITEIILQTGVIEDIKSFYTESLGLGIHSCCDERISFMAGQSLLTFQYADNFNGIYHFAFNIPANKIDEAVHWLKGRVSLVPVDAKGNIADFASWHAKAVYFKDPAGNIAEFIARFDLHNEDPAAFTAQQIINISEIGIVADDVPQAGANIMAKINTSTFSKQPASDLFTVLGDDNGLLVLVKKGRNWYLSDIPAMPAPVTIKLTDDKGVAASLHFE